MGTFPGLQVLQPVNTLMFLMSVRCTQPKELQSSDHMNHVMLHDVNQAPAEYYILTEE